MGWPHLGDWSLVLLSDSQVTCLYLESWVSCFYRTAALSFLKRWACDAVVTMAGRHWNRSPGSGIWSR